MIYLFTGINGAGKTLNALKFVDEDRDGAFKDRPIYYFNVDSLKLPWTELSLEELKCWWDLPKGSVIFVDEAYKVFPMRKAGVKPPEHVQRLAEHRKVGYDFIFICQKVVGQLDAFSRGLVGRHVHLERKFNTNRVKWLEWQSCQDNIDYHSIKAAHRNEIVRLDKKYFSAYKSAEVHTMKPNLPWFKILAISALVVFVVGLILYFILDLTSRAKPSPKPSAPSSSVANASFLPAFDGSSSAPLTYSQFVSLRTPRIAGMPSTAPMYDQLTQPKVYPRLQCIRWSDDVFDGSCVCYTQQSTKVDTSQELCNNIIKNGLFDPALEGRRSARAHSGTELAPTARRDSRY